MTEIYLDNAATTKPCREAVRACLDCLENKWGNPSSLHGKGLEAETCVREARRKIGAALGADPSEIVFTSCATESTNTAFLGTASKYGRRKKKIVTSSVEHSSVRETLKKLETMGFEVVTVSPRKDGKFYAEDFVKSCDDSTFLLTMMLVNNETGYVLPCEEVFNTVKRLWPEIICHCDAVQGFMKIPFSVKKLRCDLLSLSAHKIYAPKGSGALYIRKGITVHPLLTGGGQERGLRSGTESVPLIAAFAAAVDSLSDKMKENTAHYERLRAGLFERLREDEGISFNSDENCVPYIVNFSVRGIRSEIMLHRLEESGIYVSSGSACSKGAKSGVLGEFGASREEEDSALRLSFSPETTEADIECFVKALRAAAASIRR